MTSSDTSTQPGLCFNTTSGSKPATRGLLSVAGKLVLLQILLGAVPLCESRAQAPAPVSAASAAEISPAHSDTAALHLLKGQLLAEEGSRAEALRELALSLRAQPADGPDARSAADLLFQLLVEQRANSRIAFLGHTGAIRYASFSTDGGRLVTASDDHTARIWDIRTGQQLTSPLMHQESVLMATFSPDGSRIVTASEDHTAQVWNASTGRPIGAPMQHIDDVRSARFSPDGKRIVTGSGDGRARVWNSLSGEPLISPVVYHSTVFSARFSADGAQLLTASADGVAELLNASTGQRLLPAMRQKNSVFTAAFSPDGGRILTASADGTARLWDAHTGLASAAVLHHGYWIFSAAFSDTGDRVVTASWDHTARVWDARTGQPITPPLQHADAVYGAVFSPDGGTRVATASRDHTARVWDARTGQPVTLPLKADDEVATALFTPNAGSVLVASYDASVRLFDLPPEGPAPAWLADLADFAAMQVRYEQDHPDAIASVQRLRTQLLNATDTIANKPDERTWERFGEWYFEPADTRSVSPWSALSLQQYVAILTGHQDRLSLAYAATLAYDHPLWMKQIVPKLNALPASAAESSTPSCKKHGTTE